MNIYEIDNTILTASEAILDLVDEETGEVTDIDQFEALKAEIDGLQMERNQKISNIACWIKNLKAEADAIKLEKMKLADRQRACENKAESLQKYLEYALNGAKFEDARVKISYRTSKSVGFTDDFSAESLPAEFQKVTIEPKRADIMAALKNGSVINGCFIQEKTSMQIK